MPETEEASISREESSEVAAEAPLVSPVDPAQVEPDESFIHRIAPLFKLLRLYSRLEVEGLENIPDGRAILAANHTGWLGLDYAYTALAVLDGKKRTVRGMAHRTWFMRDDIGRMASRLGLFEADKSTMERLLQVDKLIMIFPEGERGAFKGESERYMLQPFARGFVRVAMRTGAPIIPVAIVGGEEANPSSRMITSYEDLLNMTLPSPTNFFPRPVKWRMSFLKPIAVEGGASAADDRDLVYAETERIKRVIQDELHRLVRVRGHPFW